MGQRDRGKERREREREIRKDKWELHFKTLRMLGGKFGYTM